MTYYIKLDSEPNEVLEYDSAILGQTTLTYFYPDRGFKKFTKIVHEIPEILSHVQIFDDNRQNYTALQFLKKIEKLKVAEH